MAAASTHPAETEGPSTRERILEIALELFTEQGYDKTSIRDIAERLGTTKAALYYHFKSKADILLELHLQLHALGDHMLDELEAIPAGQRSAALPRLCDELITAIDENRELVQMHERNQSALEGLRDDERHNNDDLRQRVENLFASSAIPPTVRVRLACAIGAIMAGLFSDALVGDVDHDERIALVRATVAELLRGA